MNIRPCELVEQMLILIYEMNLLPSACIGMKCIWLQYIKVNCAPKCASVHYSDFFFLGADVLSLAQRGAFLNCGTQVSLKVRRH